MHNATSACRNCWPSPNRPATNWPPTIPNGLLLTFYGSMPGCFWRSAAGVSRRTDIDKEPRRETGLGSGDKLTQWLYDSQGNPIAFRGFDTVISRTTPD